MLGRGRGRGREEEREERTLVRLLFVVNYIGVRTDVFGSHLVHGLPLDDVRHLVDKPGEDGAVGVWKGGGGGGEYGGHEFHSLFLRVHRHGLVDHTVRDHIKQCRGEVSEPDFNERRKDVDVGGLRATMEGGREERGGAGRREKEGGGEKKM